VMQCLSQMLKETLARYIYICNGLEFHDLPRLFLSFLLALILHCVCMLFFARPYRKGDSGACNPFCKQITIGEFRCSDCKVQI
jgi:hypothetical protein